MPSPLPRFDWRCAFAASCVCALFMPLYASRAAAQEPPPSTLPEATSTLSVVLLTMGPGDAIWEKFGHNALWIRDPESGTDVAYNWGMFDFTDEDLIRRLAVGDMRYWMAGYPSDAVIQAYAAAGRAVYAQDLRLSAEQKRELLRILRQTDTEENRYYSYDYYLDNCSTRVRDALDQVLDGRVRATLDTIVPGRTWRWHARRILRTTVAAYAGMELALGSPADRTITAWDEGFLPLRLRDHLRRVTVTDAAGREAPLVLTEVQLVDSDRASTAEDAPFWLPWFLAAGVLLGVGIVLPDWLAAGNRGKGGARIAALLAGGWSSIAGLAGVLLALGWLFTEHSFWYRNENLFQTSPLSLLLAPVLLASVMGRSLPRWSGPVAAAVLGLSLAGVLLQILPSLDQVNGEIIALALPMHAAVARFALRSEKRRKDAEGP